MRKKSPSGILESEARIQHDARLAVGKSEHVLWRNNTGQISPPASKVCECCGAPIRLGRPVKFGLQVGSGDLIGIQKGGRFASIELKKPGGVIRPEQIMWRDLVRSLGGIAEIAYSDDEVLEILNA